MGRGQRRANNAAVLMIALIATAHCQDGVVATEYTVGNATGWDFAPTSSYYDDWAAGLKFVPGDKLGMPRLASTLSTVPLSYSFPLPYSSGNAYPNPTFSPAR